MRQTHRRLAVAFTAVLVLLATATGGAVASNDTETNPIDELLASNDSSDEDFVSKWAPDWAEQFGAALGGQIARITSWASDFDPRDDDPTNAEDAAAFQAAANNHSEVYVDMVNRRTSPSDAYDTFEVAFVSDGSDPASVYILAELNDSTGNVTTASVVNETVFAEQNRSVDHVIAVDDDAAEGLDGLVRSYDEQFIQTREIPGQNYQAELAGRYCSVTAGFGSPADCDIRSTLWMDNETLVRNPDAA